MSKINHPDPAELLDSPFVEDVAETMGALSTGSRLRILSRLYSSPCSVGEIALAIRMERSAVSHQLRILRHLGLVVGRRTGRHVVYELHDEHVGQMLEEAMSHVDHLRACLAEHSHRGARAAA